MNAFYDNLKGVERTMYKAAFNFHKQHVEGATEDSAHEAGLKELDRLSKIRKRPAEKWIDITTRKTHIAKH